MGLVRAKTTLRNPLDSRLASYEADALADTGALCLCIPAHVAVQLQLQTVQQREVTTADGTKHVCDDVGPLEVSFENRTSFVGALVLGDDVLLGAVPMKDMDLIVSPARQKIAVNPETPNIPGAVVK